MMYLYGLRETVFFYVPVLCVHLRQSDWTDLEIRTSALSYVVGLVLYASHVPYVLHPSWESVLMTCCTEKSFDLALSLIMSLTVINFGKPAHCHRPDLIAQAGTSLF
jgi:hypothetical protein